MSTKYRIIKSINRSNEDVFWIEYRSFGFWWKFKEWVSDYETLESKVLLFKTFGEAYFKFEALKRSALENKQYKARIDCVVWEE